MTTNKPQSIPPGMERPADLPTSAPPPNLAAIGGKLESVRNAMRSASARMQTIPTRFVMTESTLEEIKRQIEDQSPCIPSGIGSLDALYGIPFEVYATSGECLSRMARQKNGERLQLISDSKPEINLEND